MLGVLAGLVRDGAAASVQGTATGAGPDSVALVPQHPVMACGTVQEEIELYLGGSNVDTIVDFEHDKDAIVLDADIFAALGGSVASNEFRKNTSGDAQDHSDKLIYNTDTGRLYYDADGSGSGNKVLIAKFDPAITTLSYHDFEIV